ncbi:MAG: AraC family transcriptional regulator [Prevotella sp.]|jgi:AraC-like DNA-binding protein|nr:AraC family transcriptional regulator [Prevotella sp.]
MKASSTIEEVTIESLKEMSKGGHIDNDLILFDDIASVPFPYGPRRMGCLLLALCLKGKAQYSVNTEKHEVEQNHIIIINEGQVTDDFLLSRDCNGIALLISTSFFREIIKNVHELSSLLLFSRNHPVWKLTPNETKTIVEYFRLLKAKVNDKEHHFRKDTVRLLLTTMIYDLSNAIYKVQQTTNEKKQTRAEHIFTEFIRMVEQNFRKERRVSWYGQQLCITPKYLSEAIKQVSHRTPNEWIDNYVTLEIRVLLKNSTKSIKEIAQELHFPNQSFLGKYFKEHVGCSPSDYRKS